MVLALSGNDPLPDHPHFPGIGSLEQRTRSGDEGRIKLKLKTSTFTCILREPLLKFYSFFGERPFTLSHKFSQKWITRGKNTLLTWDKDQIEAYTWTTLVTSIIDFRFFGERPFTWYPKVSSKWITGSRNTLRRWEKDHIEAKSMYFHLAYLGNLY